MPVNPFTRILFWFVDLVRPYPVFSTWVAGFFLSTVWTGVWIIVFAATTAVLELQTSAKDFLVVLWLSVAVEAVIRWAENTIFVVRLSKPKELAPKPDNEDYRVGRAISIFATLVAIIGTLFFLVTDMKDVELQLLSLEFSGVREQSSAGWVKMFVRWWETFTHDYVIFGTLGALVARAYIYRRLP